jgi:hypothetical protein
MPGVRILPTVALCAIPYRQRPILPLDYSFIYLNRAAMYIATNPVRVIVIGILILLVPNFKLFRETVYLIVVGILGLMYHNLTLGGQSPRRFGMVFNLTFFL